MKEEKRMVIRVDKSPMNPRRKCVELECGHEEWVSRAPCVGTHIKCQECSRLASTSSDGTDLPALS